MKCPKCGRELILGGKVSKVVMVKEGQKLEPPIKYENYFCENKKCPNYGKTLTYDVELKRWV